MGSESSSTADDAEIARQYEAADIRATQVEKHRLRDYRDLFKDAKKESAYHDKDAQVAGDTYKHLLYDFEMHHGLTEPGMDEETIKSTTIAYKGMIIQMLENHKKEQLTVDLLRKKYGYEPMIEKSRIFRTKTVKKSAMAAEDATGEGIKEEYAKITTDYPLPDEISTYDQCKARSKELGSRKHPVRPLTKPSPAEVRTFRKDIPPSRASVGKLALVRRDGILAGCSAELIANEDEEGATPYIMTAAHCGSAVRWSRSKRRLEFKLAHGADTIYFCPSFHNLTKDKGLLKKWFEKGKCIRITEMWFPQRWTNWYEKEEIVFTHREEIRAFNTYNTLTAEDQASLRRHYVDAYAMISKYFEKREERWLYDFAIMKLETVPEHLPGFLVEEMPVDLFNQLTFPFYPTQSGEIFNIEVVGYPGVQSDKFSDYWQDLGGGKLLATQFLNKEMYETQPQEIGQILHLYIAAHKGASGGALLINDRFYGVVSHGVEGEYSGYRIFNHDWKYFIDYVRQEGYLGAGARYDGNTIFRPTKHIIEDIIPVHRASREIFNYNEYNGYYDDGYDGYDVYDVYDSLESDYNLNGITYDFKNEYILMIGIGVIMCCLLFVLCFCVSFVIGYISAKYIKRNKLNTYRFVEQENNV